MPAPRATVRPRTAAGRPASAGRPATGGRGAPVRPVLSAREAQALREALAARQAEVGRTTAARTPAAPRTAGRTARTTTRRAHVRTPAGRSPARRRPAPTRTGLRWATRLKVVGIGTLVLPAVAALVLPGPSAPRPDPLDPTALALAAQGTLLQHADSYRRLEQEVQARRAELQQASDAVRVAHERAAAEQRVVGAGAASLYRSAPEGRVPALALDVHDPASVAGVLFQQALADRSDRELEGALVRAQRAGTALAEAAGRVARAEHAVATAEREAAGALAAARVEAGALGAEVSGRLAGLATVPAAGGQQERNQQAVARWQGYLAGLAAAGIELPRAADLADPGRLPAGLSPALDAAGQPVPGVAWAVIGSSPVTVVPAETATAVSGALAWLGRPFVPGTAGPDSFDCGGFTAAAWLLAGYALPASPAEQWASGMPVPIGDLQVGDVVVLSGGQDVALYLGAGEVLGASGASYQVGVRSLPADAAVAVRVPLGAAAQPNPPLVPDASVGACGAPLPPPPADGVATVDPAWGGWANGRIPAEALCRLGVGSHALRCDAAAAFAAMSQAYEAAFGGPLCLTDSYRSYASQVSAFARKPALAAVPGTSNHGWALAVDLCGGVHRGGSPQWQWMAANAGRFGWVQPAWAGPRGEKPEPWHWEFGVIS